MMTAALSTRRGKRPKQNTGSAARKKSSSESITEMGLLIDKNGIPLAFDLFPGNESEKVHKRSIINRVKSQFGSVGSSLRPTGAEHLGQYLFSGRRQQGRP